MGGISIWQLLIAAFVVVLLFGGNRLRNLGGDLGASLKDFKKAISDDESEEKSKTMAKSEQVAAKEMVEKDSE